jgi:hypothetical protein
VAALKARMKPAWERSAMIFAFLVGTRAVASTVGTRARHRRSQGFHQNRKTTLRRHSAELCFKAEIDDAIREDGNQIATLSDCGFNQVKELLGAQYPVQQCKKTRTRIGC